MDRPEGSLPLPPLAALRAFEAAARLESFTRAAEELCVTQTAVSHQIRLLEETLGTRLFDRRPRRVQLTPHGRAWADATSEAFSRLYEANRVLRSSPRSVRRVVSVTVLPSFATRWLVPRLGRFLELHPQIDLHISPSEELVDLNAREVDVAIRYGAGRYPDLKSEKLCQDAWVAVCAPDMKGRAKLRTPRDLSAFTLLHDDNAGWQEWLRARGLERIDARRGPLLTDSGMVVEAAVQGQGVGLVRLSLAAAELAAGRLLRPFPRVPLLPTKMSYYLAWAKIRPLRPEVSAFCDWIRSEVAGLRELGL